MRKGSILALDLAETTGWAIASEEAVANWPLSFGELLKGAGPIEGVRYGSQRFSSVTGRHGVVYLSCARWLRDMIDFHRPCIIFMEAPLPQHKSASSARRALGLSAVAEITAEEKGVDIFEEHVSTVRKHFAGSGHAKKPDIIARCIDRGWNPQDNNASDALALLDHGICLVRRPRKAA